MKINHNLTFTTKTNAIILLPFGMFVHADIKEGETAEFYDGVGRVVSVSEISIGTSMANTLSLGIYGLPIVIVMGKMIDNWGDRIWKDRVLVLTVKRI